MTRLKLRYVQRFADRHGKVRHYFRKPGSQRIPLPGLPGSVEFMGAYQAAIEGVTPEPSKRAKPGTMAALIAAYYASSDFRSLAESTKRSYRSVIDEFRKKHGDKPVALIEAPHIRSILDDKAETPGAANNLRKRLRTLMRFAVERGMRRDDPTLGVRKLRTGGDGFHSWTDAEIEAFEATWALGTRERLALALLLYTAQRRSDVVTMGRQHMRGALIHVNQQKTKTRLAIPVHPELRKAIDASPLGNMTFLVTEYGKPFSAAGFGNWFRERCSKAGLPHCSAHGLRKAAARRLAEAGCSAHQIMAVTGHKSLKEVDVYTAAANQERLAEQAILMMSRDK